MVIPTAEIVKGDVLVLEAGDLVAADGRLIQAASLRCVESALTGESEAAGKSPEPLESPDVPLGDRRNLVYMGTTVAAGTGQAVVVATAMETELGRIAGLMRSARVDEGTPLQKQLDGFGRVLIWGALGIVALQFGLGWMRGVAPLALFMTAISLAVAAIPEGLPAIVTVALALGVRRLARQRALVRKLAAVETLGSTDVICTDKTGTLTVGEMTARELYIDGTSYEVTGEGYGPDGEILREGQRLDGNQLEPVRELAAILAGCNNSHLVQEEGSWKTIGDPTEGALLAAAAKAGVTRQQVESKWPKQYENPFDSDRKRSSVVRQMPGGRQRAFVNGAPAELLQHCTHRYTSAGIAPLSEADRERILAQICVLAGRALRVLGAAYRDLAPGLNHTAGEIECDLVFVGLTGMYDPPRPAAQAAVRDCVSAGIRVVMITGDHPSTAASIAHDLGIRDQRAAEAVVTGIALNQMDDAELERRAPGIAVYARVTAEHKLRVVRALQARQHTVAMTGDGVNDAPAIAKADIGIAMGKSGTDVTKQAADMIITDDDFATIVMAVKQGRGIYDNIRKTLQYLLAGNTAELMLMTVCVAVGLPSPLLPIHLLWINLVTDGLPALCLATDPVEPDVMSRPPRRSRSMADRQFLRTMLFTGFLTAAVSLGVYLAALQAGSIEHARSSAFSVLVFAELLRAFGARSETKPIWRIPLFTNWNLVIVVAVTFGLQVLSQHNAVWGRFLKSSYLPLSDCLILVLYGAIPLIVLEIVKILRRSVLPSTASLQ
jgi:Ca2+-transporting ATPase